jgi:hypothetical protein
MSKNHKKYVIFELVSNFLKSFFSQPKAAGFIAMHKKEGKQYELKERISL